MKKIAIITGVNGQDGAYLSDFLLSKDYQVIGIIRNKDSNIDNLSYFGRENDITFEYGDLRDQAFIQQTIQRYQPDEIYNLGGLTSPFESWSQTREYIDTNVSAIVNIIESVHQLSKHTKIFQASSSELYGSIKEQKKLNEDDIFSPTNPYALTKLFGHYFSKLSREKNNIFIATGILFNHESPLRTNKFVSKKIIEGITRISLGMQDTLSLGNIDIEKDWGFAGDYVEAMWLVLQQEQAEDYVIATGEAHSLKEFIQVASEYLNISNVEKYIEIDPRFYQPTTSFPFIGDNSKLKKLGWAPKHNFSQLIKMMVDGEIKKIKKI